MSGPGDDGVEHDRSPVGRGVLVVAGHESAPLLELAEAPFDHVALPVVGRIEGGRSAASGTAAFAVSDLVDWLRDCGGDAVIPEVGADRARRIGLVATSFLGPGPGAATGRGTRNSASSGSSIGESLA